MVLLNFFRVLGGFSYKCCRVTTPLWLSLPWLMLDLCIPASHQKQCPGPVSPTLPVCKQG